MTSISQLNFTHLAENIQNGVLNLLGADSVRMLSDSHFKASLITDVNAICKFTKALADAQKPSNNGLPRRSSGQTGAKAGQRTTHSTGSTGSLQAGSGQANNGQRTTDNGLLAAFHAIRHPSSLMKMTMVNTLCSLNCLTEAKEIFHTIDCDSLLSDRQKFQYAVILAKFDNSKAAEKLVQNLYVANPDLKDGFSRIAWEYRAKGNMEKTEELLGKDYREHRQTSAWLITYATLLVQLDRTPEAKAVIEKINAEKFLQNAGTPGQVIQLLTVLVRVDRIAESLRLLESANLTEHFGEINAMDIHLRIANVLLMANANEEAKALIDHQDFLLLGQGSKDIPLAKRQVVAFLAAHDFDRATAAAFSAIRGWRNSKSIIWRIKKPLDVFPLASQLQGALNALKVFSQKTDVSMSGFMGLRNRLAVLRAIDALDDELTAVPFETKNIWIESCGDPFKFIDDPGRSVLSMRYAAMCAWHSCTQIAETMLLPPSLPITEMPWYEAYTRGDVAYSLYGFTAMHEFNIEPKWPLRYAHRFLSMKFMSALHLADKNLASTALTQLQRLHGARNWEHNPMLRMMEIMNDEMFDAVSADAIEFLSNLDLDKVSTAAILQLLSIFQRHNLTTQSRKALYMLDISQFPLDVHGAHKAIARICGSVVALGTPLFIRALNILQGTTWRESLIARADGK